AVRQNQFDGYLFNEILPFSLKQNPNPQVIVTGMELGGYQALNFGFRHPERVTRVLSIGGVADIRRFVNGYYDDSVYFSNPCDFLANEHEPARLQALRRLDIILAIGSADPEYAANLRLSEILWSKGIWHALRVWQVPANNWQAWKRMLPMYVRGHD